MGNIGFPEMLVIAVVALLVFGPRRLPDMARQAGKALKEFKRVTGDLTDELKSGLDDPAFHDPAANDPATNDPAFHPWPAGSQPALPVESQSVTTKLGPAESEGSTNQDLESQAKDYPPGKEPV